MESLNNNTQVPLSEVYSLIENLVTKHDLEVLFETIVDKFCA